MARAPFQVSVFPYYLEDGPPEYLILYRADDRYWQCIAGGGEDGETHLDAAKRESWEEAAISPARDYLQLTTMTYVPRYHFNGPFEWPADLLVLPLYYFAVRLASRDVALSHEHTAARWVDYATAIDLLHWDTDKTALWELDMRLKRVAGDTTL